MTDDRPGGWCDDGVVLIDGIRFMTKLRFVNCCGGLLINEYECWQW